MALFCGFFLAFQAIALIVAVHRLGRLKEENAKLLKASRVLARRLLEAVAEHPERFQPEAEAFPKHLLN